MEPPDDVEQPVVGDDHVGLTAHHMDAAHRIAELVHERGRGRIRLAAGERHLARGDGGRRVGAECASRHDGSEWCAHRPDRVWWTEFPNGSDSSSMTDGGM